MCWQRHCVYDALPWPSQGKSTFLSTLKASAVNSSYLLALLTLAEQSIFKTPLFVLDSNTMRSTGRGTWLPTQKKRHCYGGEEWDQVSLGHGALFFCAKSTPGARPKSGTSLVEGQTIVLNNINDIS